jgi:hypothetical protein
MANIVLLLLNLQEQQNNLDDIIACRHFHLTNEMVIPLRKVL